MQPPPPDTDRTHVMDQVRVYFGTHDLSTGTPPAKGNPVIHTVVAGQIAAWYRSPGCGPQDWEYLNAFASNGAIITAGTLDAIAQTIRIIDMCSPGLVGPGSVAGAQEERAALRALDGYVRACTVDGAHPVDGVQARLNAALDEAAQAADRAAQMHIAVAAHIICRAYAGLEPAYALLHIEPDGDGRPVVDVDSVLDARRKPFIVDYDEGGSEAIGEAQRLLAVAVDLVGGDIFEPAPDKTIGGTHWLNLRATTNDTTPATTTQDAVERAGSPT
jgi:hypothetical protein